MPELPEVERTRQTLAEALAGARIAGVRVHRPDVVTGPARPRDLLVNAEGIRTHRHGKQLALEAGDGRVLLAHLGMTGGFGVQASRQRQALPAHTHVVWTIVRADESRATLRFTDPRRFGGLWTYPDLATLRAARWQELGPDALTIRSKDLRRFLNGSRRAIKACLLDQRTIAGVGNIYADEALFLARLNPATPAGAIAGRDLTVLTRHLRGVMTRAIQSGGSTLRDYRDAAGVSGSFQRQHKVYGRGGEPCVRCRTVLQSAQVAQRTTVWCPACQPG